MQDRVLQRRVHGVSDGEEALMTDAEIKTALSVRDAVALTLWGEARNEPIEGIVGVANVIRHRQLKTGRSWKYVVHQRLQFTCWWPQGGAANYERVISLARKIVTGQGITQVSWYECDWIAEGILLGRFRDNVQGARHYLTTALLATNPPAWVKSGRRVADIGHHIFFAGVP
jgi:spore germination cell wall hydrolase CwlJ-like protein